MDDQKEARLQVWLKEYELAQEMSLRIVERSWTSASILFAASYVFLGVAVGERSPLLGSLAGRLTAAFIFALPQVTWWLLVRRWRAFNLLHDERARQIERRLNELTSLHEDRQHTLAKKLHKERSLHVDDECIWTPMITGNTVAMVLPWLSIGAGLFLLLFNL